MNRFSGRFQVAVTDISYCTLDKFSGYQSLDARQVGHLCSPDSLNGLHDGLGHSLELANFVVAARGRQALLSL